MVNTSESTLAIKLPVMPLSTSVLFFASLSLELYYLIKRRISIYIYIIIYFYIYIIKLSCPVCLSLAI